MKSKSIRLSGDKSISHRALMISSISKGDSQITNLCDSRDVQSTIECLRLCGAIIEKSANKYIVRSSSLSNPQKSLNCGNSGTTIRLLMGLLSGQGIEAELYGDDSLMSRPMDRVINPLNHMGADISYGNKKIYIKKGNVKGGTVKNRTSSAQVKSSIIFAALGGNKKTILQEYCHTRDHTERMLSYFSRDSVYVKGHSIEIKPGLLTGRNINVAGDISKASFLIAFGCLLEGADLIIKSCLINSSRIGFLNALKKMGADIKVYDKKLKYGELIADIRVKYSPQLKNIRISPQNVRDMIDEIPILSVVSVFSKGIMSVSGISELKIKESNRVLAIISNLRAMGCDARESGDSILIKGSKILYGTNIKTFSDHRIAMAFYIAGLFAKRKQVLDDLRCIDISFPSFFDKMSEVGA